MVITLKGIWLNFMVILSLFLIYTSTNNLTFYGGIFFFVYYMLRLYNHNKIKSS
jgi:hypothetical protein